MASRNRPRAGMVKEEMGDELNLWNAIVEKIKRCRTINDKYDSVVLSGVPAIEQKMQTDSAPAKEAIAQLEELEKLQREGVKLAEEELKILNEEPENLLQNLETLISVLSAFEAEPSAPKINTNPKQRPKRKIETDGANDSPIQTPETATPAPNSASRQMSKNVSRSGSVAAPSVKSENGGDAEPAIKAVAPSSTEKSQQPKFAVGTEVFYRKTSSDGAGILCKVTKIKVEGKQRRYEILDTEPEPDTVPETVSHLSLVAIPAVGTAVHEIAKGQQVFALYPETSTFYRAEVVTTKGTKKDHCRLRFEGEEEKGTEQEVERRYVLDVKKCEK